MSWTRSCTWCVPAAPGGSYLVDFPPWQTVYWYFVRGEEGQGHRADPDSALRRRGFAPGRAGQAEPSAGIIDSQSVKGADTVGRDSRGYDANKKINGRKRFIVTDTLGLLLVVCVMAASVQDRDGAKTTLLSLYLAHTGPVRLRRRRVRRDTGGLDTQDLADRAAHRPQGAWSERARGDPAPLGGRTLPGLADRLPTAGPRLRTPPPPPREAMIRGAAITGIARRLTRGHRQAATETNTRPADVTF